VLILGTLRGLWLPAMMAGLLALAVPAVAGQQAARDAETSRGFDVTGKVQHPLHRTASDLEKLPSIEVHASFLGMHGKETATYTGVSLWDVLMQAGAFDPSKPRSRVAIVVYVTGRDGYTVALAIPEMDPAFEGKHVIIAYRKDGQLLPHGDVRLVVPGDLHGARSVRDVVAIAVR